MPPLSDMGPQNGFVPPPDLPFRSGQYLSSESPRPSHQHTNPTEHSATALRSLSVAESLDPSWPRCRKREQCVYSTYIHPRWRVTHGYCTGVPIRKQSGRPAAETISTDERGSGNLSPGG